MARGAEVDIFRAGAGGCAASVMVKLDWERDLRAYPDFGQLLFYGDYGRELLDCCKLFGIEAAAM